MKSNKLNRNCRGIVLVVVCVLFYGLSLGAVECVFEDTEFSFQFLRTMGYTASVGADIGECLNTARRIKDKDMESWYTEWLKTAKQLNSAADGFLAKGHKISAKEAYFRASNYYRTAEFFLHGNPKDPRILKTWGKSRECFQNAAKFSDKPIKYIRIPFENTTMPGYLCLVDDSGKKRPLLIVHTGFDGTAEELYMEIGFRAVERGFNVLLFEGPGQGEMIRVQHMPYRYNWETVVTPVVDYAIKLPETDPDKIGLIGFSFGGYLAPRAVAYEHRIKACVADGGVYDFFANALRLSHIKNGEELDNKSACKKINEGIRASMKKSSAACWFFENGMFTFKTDSPTDFLKKLKPFNLTDSVKKIKCNMLVINSESDTGMTGQAKQLFDALDCPKEFMLFTIAEGAEEHCQMGAMMISSERILNWLQNILMKNQQN